ncbi:MAG: hypothetical protein E7629_07115 [Ruminococcaceae bacterium]|nr:hypothetical protein [Oscillospiraceae bacterium]
MLQKFLEQGFFPICDKETLKSLGVDKLLYNPKFNISDYFTDDIAVLQRRSVVFGDVLNVAGLYDLLQKMTKRLSSFSEILRSESEIGNKERSIFSAKQLQLYFEIIDEAEQYYVTLPDKEFFASEEFKQLFEQIHTIANSKEYLDLKKGTHKLINKITHIKSISVGFNFDTKLSPVEMGITSINDQYIQSGKLIDKILRMDFSADGLQAIEPIVAVDKTLFSDEFDVLQNSLLRAVDKIFTRAIRDWPREFTKYIEDQLSFLLNLLSDFQFILVVTEIHKKLMESGVPMCVPNYHGKDERVFHAKRLYNPALAIRMSEVGESGKLVGNDVKFDDKGRIYILTGPNNGGKSVFMVSVGMAQILAQLGMLVPAEQLDISPVDHIYVHFPEYQTKEKMGRLEDECARVKDIFATINEYSLCLFDETFSSTDSDEGCQLAFEVLRAIESFGAHAIFGTHFHHLVRLIDEAKTELNVCQSFDYLCAGIFGGKQRTYRITRSKPEGKSYASAIAEKYGLSYEKLAHD